ncbi:HAD domain-containing protein [Streptomyces sp. NPDC058092]|uniref:HAD domain-containing protein n=1 Tax=Streptomyces sp. NPDC058092 TaxID=3346336 RepID=UPI0036E9A4BB
MTGPAERPYLFLDVDGPLIPFGTAAHQPSGEHPVFRTGDESSGPGSNPLLARIDPGLGSRLAALPCDLVWATSWMADANDSVAPRLGLPELPVVVWPEPSDEDERDERAGLHWKTRTVLRWAAGRPFVWVDDEITDTDRAWVSSRHGGRALLHRVDPCRGLTDADFTVLNAWLLGCRTASPTAERAPTR